jgi:phage baseplate assembly protein W
VASIDLNSVINSSIVPSIALEIGASVNSFANSSSIPSITQSSRYSVNSFSNSNSISPLTMGVRLYVDSAINSSIVNLISRDPNAIGLNSIINASIVSPVILPFNVNLSHETISNQSKVPLIIVTNGIVVNNVITPIVRPKKTTSVSTTGFKKFVFRDLAMKGGSHPLTGDLVTVTDFHAVSQSIRNIVMTNPSERFFDHIEFGVGIEKYLFDTYDNGLQGRIKDDIISQIAAHEPRALIVDVILNGESFRHELSIEIIFKIKTTQVTSSVTILLERR